MKIAIVVPGRFHAFDFAAALIRRGHEVKVFTNYPKRIAKRWGLSSENLVTYVPHGLAVRSAGHVRKHVGVGHRGHWALPTFGAWAARALRREAWDVVYGFSGASLEILKQAERPAPLIIVGRFSAHIEEQKVLLDGEAERTGSDIHRPDQSDVDRELQEYALADFVLVECGFAWKSFVDRNYPQERLLMVPPAASTSFFRCSGSDLERRVERIRCGQPLRAIYVGALSAQKGMFDLAEVIRRSPESRFRFTLVGSETPETRRFFLDVRDRPDCHFVGHRPESELHRWYSDGDLFVFPTIHDGSPLTLEQAMASGLPAVTTRNCSGPDVLEVGATGWIVPPRSPEEILAVLDWCDGHREELSSMCRHVAERSGRGRTWDDAAGDFEREVARAASISSTTFAM